MTGATTSTVELGDMDDVRSLMIDVRRFLAPNSDIQYQKIYKLLNLRLKDDDLREANHKKYEGPPPSAARSARTPSSPRATSRWPTRRQRSRSRVGGVADRTPRWTFACISGLARAQGAACGA